MLRDKISESLIRLNATFGTAIFSHPKQFKAALSDIVIEQDAKKIRNLLNIAIGDMKVFSRLEAGLAGNPFIIDNLATEMSMDYMIDYHAAKIVIECLAELLGHRVANPTTIQSPSTSKIVVYSDSKYQIGDTGPAGGIIFYDKGNFSEGWRYLETSHHKQEFISNWTLKWIDVSGTLETIGSGKHNTELIVTACDQTLAAIKCIELDINGFKDWFLPSKDELNLMYMNLKMQNLGNFCNDRYWSSSQLENVDVGAWTQLFKNGAQNGYYPKFNHCYVRAIRMC